MKLLAITGLLLLSTQSFANEKVVYGVDNRMDLYETNDSLYQELAASTAAMIPSWAMKEIKEGENKGTYEFPGRSLGVKKGLCKDERYYDQLAPANCSGFLVAPDLVVTAGHCVKSQSSCTSSNWVFNFAISEEGNQTNTVTKDDVYKCVEIVDRKYDGYKNDYALIKLDRPVVGRAPLKVRTEGKVSDDASLVLIGHPTGLPTKVSPGAAVRTNSNPIYFVSTTDSFGGNSGSAVFNETTGEVEGILVRGERDYKYDYSAKCTRVNYCEEDECRGEDVTRITNIAPLMEMLK